MADKKKSRRKQTDDEKPSKEEYAVAKFLRFNCPVRQGKLVGMSVACFIASQAIDELLKSKYSSANGDKTDALFTNRQSCISYMDRLLQKGLFHRAEKVERRKDKAKKKKKIKDEVEEEKAVVEDKKSKKDKKGKKEKETEKDIDRSDDGDKKSDTTKERKKKEDKEEIKEEKKDEEKKKKERKFKLNMHDDQRFVDGDEVYVWIYDPVPAKTFIIGLLMVLGAIGLCLFPLWPPEVRLGVYYISLLAAGFVGVILALIVIRFILFCGVWLFTFGKHHFWFLPNLTEDVGFFDSFKPLYKHDMVKADEKDKKEGEALKSKKKSKEKEKSSDKDESENDKNSDNDEFEIVEKTDVEETTDEKQVDEEENDEDEEEEENGDDSSLDAESKKDK